MVIEEEELWEPSCPYCGQVYPDFGHEKYCGKGAVSVFSTGYDDWDDTSGTED